MNITVAKDVCDFLTPEDFVVLSFTQIRLKEDGAIRFAKRYLPGAVVKGDTTFSFNERWYDEEEDTKVTVEGGVVTFSSNNDNNGEAQPQPFFHLLAEDVRMGMISCALSTLTTASLISKKLVITDTQKLTLAKA